MIECLSRHIFLDIKFFKQYLPKNVIKTVEPFAGGSAVSLYLYNINNDIKCVLNDIDDRLINFYIDMKTKSDTIMDRINNFTKTMTKETFREEINKYLSKSYAPEDSSYYYYFHNHVHGPRCGMYPNRKVGDINLSKFKTYLSWIDKSMFTNHDFKLVLDLYKDDEEAFVFLDPHI